MSDQQVKRLARLLSLQQAAQELTSLSEFDFFTVNETHQLLPYETAILWESTARNTLKIRALSAIAIIDPHAPLVQWAQQLVSHLYQQPDNTKIQEVKLDALPEDISQNCPEALGKHILWCPFYRQEKAFTAGLLLIREQAWSQQEQDMLFWLIQSYTYCWLYLNARESYKHYLRKPFRVKKSIVISLLIIAALAMFIPVKQTVLAPAEVIAKEPFTVTAPIQGVIKQIEVKPNEDVTAGQLLFSMDKTELSSIYNLALQELQVTRSEYTKAIQKGFLEQESRAEINILQAEIEEKKLEVAFTASQLAKADITAEEPGIIVFSSVEEWIGKPVVTGEKIMQIAQPEKVDIEIWLPVADAIYFTVGSEVKLFSSSDPVNPIPATITYVSYYAQLTPEQTLAYRLVATLNESNANIPRLGTQGTAKIYGKYVTLFYYLFRRPIAALRQFVGW